VKGAGNGKEKEEDGSALEIWRCARRTDDAAKCALSHQPLHRVVRLTERVG